MVISSLAEKSVKKNNNIVPYRLINFKINSKRFIINKNIVKCFGRKLKNYYDLRNIPSRNKL
jgi:hypothetical protein